MKINISGSILHENEAVLPVDNRGLLYGDALFETMRLSGGKLLFWEDHYFRLMASMRIMRMDIPMEYTPEYLELEIKKTADANEIGNQAARIRLTVWRNPGGRYIPEDRGVSFMITVDKLEAPFYILPEKQCEIELFKDHYLNSGLLSTIKSNNKLINVLAGIYAEENDYDNCLLLNENKQVVEALNGNIFLVSGYKIKTPPLSDGCLKGVMRKRIIEVIAELPDYILDESSVSPFELQKADEIFITNVISGIIPVTQYRKKAYSSNVARDLIGKLNVKARFS